MEGKRLNAKYRPVLSFTLHLLPMTQSWENSLWLSLRFAIALVKVDIRRAKMLMTTWQYLDGIELISTQNTIDKIIKEA